MVKNKKSNNKKKNVSKTYIPKQLGTLYKNLKIHDVAFTTTLSTTAGIINLCSIPQGVDVFQRTGSSIVPHTLEVKLTINPSTTLVGSALANARLFIIQDLQQVQATAPLITDLINPASVVGHRNRYFLNRFRVLKEMRYRVSSYISPINRSLVIKMPRDSITFGSGSSTDIAVKGLWLVYVGDNSTNPCSLDWSSRLYFVNP